jgi:hypothetical protein
MRFKKLAMSAICAAIGMGASPMRAGAQITTFLYQGSGTETPQSQGWLDFADNAILGDGTPAVTSSGGSTTLDTTGANNIPSTSSNIEAGYSNYNPTGTLVNPSFPVLNPATGFSISFDVDVNSESNGSDSDRSGFDVILLGSDMKGVELGFWDTDIWAQNYNSGSPGTFTRDEDFNIIHDGNPAITTQAMTHYTLSILNGVYTLTSGTTDPFTILSDPVHDYTGSGKLPYTLPNYVFIGDDTTDAQASETFTDLAVTVVPEPATATGLMAIGVGILARRRRR